VSDTASIVLLGSTAGGVTRLTCLRTVIDWLVQSCEPAGKDVRCGGVVNAERAVRTTLADAGPR